MFCPKCGALLARREEPYPTFYCAPGDMALSAHLAAQLIQRYEGPPSPSQSPLPAFNRQLHSSLRWYCPGCGVRLDAHLDCAQCRKHLRDLVFPLIELHPHRPV